MITVTPSATDYFSQLLSKKNKSLDLQSTQAIYLTVKPSGCAEYRYDLNFIEHSKIQPGSIEIILNAEKKHQLIVDPESIKFLENLEIDCVTRGLSKSIKFINPKAKNTCGCGESFSLK